MFARPAVPITACICSLIQMGDTIELASTHHVFGRQNETLNLCQLIRDPGAPYRALIRASVHRSWCQTAPTHGRRTAAGTWTVTQCTRTDALREINTIITEEHTTGSRTSIAVLCPACGGWEEKAVRRNERPKPP